MDPGLQLQAHLQVSPERIQVGDSIQMKMSVVNIGKRTVFLECPTTDVELFNSEGLAVYRTANKPGLAICPGTLTLAPGEVQPLEWWFRVRETSGEPAPPDTYRVRSSIAGNGVAPVLSSLVSFSVTE